MKELEDDLKESISIPREIDVIEEIEEEESLADRVRVLSPTRLVIKRFFRSKLSVVGLVTLLLLFAFSFFGPLMCPYKQDEVDRSGKDGEMFVTEMEVVGADGEVYIVYDIVIDKMEVNTYAPPSWKHWLGTDENGRDVLARLMYGGRISLTIGFVVVILQTLLGVILGGLAGYFGKWVDQVIMRIVDMFNCLPTLPILLIASAILDAWGVPHQYRIYCLMIILTIFGWAGTARLVRGQILSLREQEFMVAEEVLGMPVRKKIFKHLIPNVMPQLIVSMTLGLGSVILMEATLSFLGLGMPYDYAAWGSMISSANAIPIIMERYINIWIPPGICIILAILSFNFVGDGLRDAFDPKMKR